jgi:hypothetical protein
VQTEVIQAGLDMGKDYSAGAEEDGLLDVGVHPPDVCDNAEQLGQDAHLWRAAGRTGAQVKEGARMLSRGPGACHWIAAALCRVVPASIALGACWTGQDGGTSVLALFVERSIQAAALAH